MTPRPAEFDRLRQEHGWDITSRFRLERGLWVDREPSITVVSYPESGHASLMAAEDGSFWFRSRARSILAAYRRWGAGKCLWEVGAGNGHVAATLLAAGIEAVAVEPGPVGIANAESRGVPAIRAVLGDLDLPSGSLGAVGIFDVLEHLEDPRTLLAEIHRVLRADGRLFITVPAYQWLWSEKDVVAGHFRRYTRSTLESQLSEAGFLPLESRYLFPSLVLPMALRYRVPFILRGARPSDEVTARVAQDLASGGGLASRVVNAAFAAEGWLTRTAKAPFGTTVLGAYRAG